MTIACRNYIYEQPANHGRLGVRRQKTFLGLRYCFDNFKEEKVSSTWRSTSREKYRVAKWLTKPECNYNWDGKLQSGARVRLCKMFSESSTGHWAVLRLPCCPSKQGNLSENILQNIFHNPTPKTVQGHHQGSASGRALEAFWTLALRFFFRRDQLATTIASPLLPYSSL